MKCVNLKKAAMFGLDARIALAIFGALSVISGAALYSAIGNAKAVSMLADMKEIGKAWEAYYFDTGTNLDRVGATKATTSWYWLKSGQLVSDTKKGWKGPYLPYEKSISIDFTGLEYDMPSEVGLIQLRTDNSWGGPSNAWSAGICTAGNNCGLWVQINKIDSISIANNIDKIVDNADGFDKGTFRVTGDGTGTYKYRYNLLISPIKNPND